MILNAKKGCLSAAISGLALKFMALFEDTCIPPHGTDNNATHNPLTRLLKYAFNQIC